MQRHNIATVLMNLLVAGMLLPASARVLTSKASTGWGLETTWDPEFVPTIDDSVIIRVEDSVTLSATLAEARRVENYGTLKNTTDRGLRASGQFHNYGSVRYAMGASSIRHFLEVGDTLHNHPGATLAIAGATLRVLGPFSNDGNCSRTGYIGTYSYTEVSGNFVNDGEYTQSTNTNSGRTTVHGDFTNAANATFNNSTNGALNFNGNFSNNQAGANFGTGMVTFGGSTNTVVQSVEPLRFKRMRQNKATNDNHLALGCNLQVDSIMTMDVGVFVLGESQLTLGTTATSCKATVNSGGRFSAVGSGPDANAAVVAADATCPYGLAVNSGGAIAARYATFRWMSAYGIVVNDGALVDPIDNFSYCSFDHGTISGPMLKVENSQVLEVLLYTNFDGTAGQNIEKLTDAGHINVVLGYGTRWGEDYDNDPYNRVNWVNVALSDQSCLAVRRRQCTATVVRGILHLAVDSRQHTAYEAVLLDITGRRAAKLVPGPNDVSGLAPGVYFVRTETGKRLARVVVAK